MGISCHRKHELIRACFTLLAAVALAFNIAVPQGFMPAKAADGTAHIVICTGHGPITAELALNKIDPAKQGKSHTGDDGSRCPFAGHAAPAGPGSPPPPLADAFPRYDLSPQKPRDEAAPGRGMPAPPPPSRAPPMLANV